MNKTSIEWTQNGYTWNPTVGCTHVSAGCANCYAEALSLRFGRSKHPWIKPYEVENVQLQPERLQQPFTVKEPAYVFVDSMSDLFHDLVPADYLDRVFEVMAACPHLTFQILTKRPERMCGYVWNRDDDPLPNVWLGTSIEDQRVTERIDWLVKTPAAIRFLSCEPLIGPLNLKPWLWEEAGPVWAGSNPSPDLDWIIVGGESGPHHRPVDPAWVRSLRDQVLDVRSCTGGDEPAFFFKQVGGRTPKAGGRLLDGREWNEMPTPRTAERQLSLMGVA